MNGTPPRVVHAIQAPLGMGGIGSIAWAEILGLESRGMLARGFTSNCPRELLSRPITRMRFTNRIPSSRHRERIFDRWVAWRMPDCDVLYLWNAPTLASLRTARRRGAKVIVVCASTHPEAQRELLLEESRLHGMGQAPEERAVREKVRQLQEADAVLVPSAFVERTFLERGFDPTRLRRAPFGVDLERFRPSPEPEGLFRLLFVGQANLRKGIPYLLAAFQALSAPRKELLLTGPVHPSVRPMVEEAVSRGNVRAMGMVGDPSACYREATVCCFPSIEEGSALVSYEAMASGRATVVTPNVGSLIEDGRTGLVVPIRDVGALAGALQRLHDDPGLRARLGKAARVVVEAYPWSRYGAEVARFAGELVGA